MSDEARREKIRVRIYTATHHRVDGEVVILEGYRGRLSDVLNDGRLFLPISNAEVYDEKGELISQSHFVSINKTAASLIIPLD